MFSAEEEKLIYERQLVEAFAQQAGCSIEEAWEHWSIIQQPGYFLPMYPATRH